MSNIEYNNLLFVISEKLDQENVLERLHFMCREKLASASNRQDSIQDTLSLFKELEDRNHLPAGSAGSERLAQRFKRMVPFRKSKKIREHKNRIHWLERADYSRTRRTQ